MSGSAGPDNPTARIRVLLCDDHDGVRGALRLLLAAEPDVVVVGEAADGRTLLRLASERPADVILLDVSLPDLSGFAVAAELRRSGTSPKVLALSAHEDQGYIEQMRAAGAAGYVVKRRVSDLLVRTIRDVVGRDGVGRDGVGRAPVNTTAQPDAGRPSAPRPDVPSGPEAELLRRLAAGQSRKQIAAALGLELVEVEARQQEAMDRLGLRTRADVVRFARGCGWLPAPER